MLTPEDLRQTLADALADTRVRRVLLIHPDYSRNDFTSLLVPSLYDRLRDLGLERLDTLNAGGTHRPMSADELHAKLGLHPPTHPLLGERANHHHPVNSLRRSSRVLLSSRSGIEYDLLRVT